MENDIVNLFSWAYWTIEKSAVVRNFSLGVAGIIGLVFLIWRAISADKAAHAALKQSEAAGKQIKVAIQQSEIAAKQAEAFSKQSEAAVKQAEIARNQQILDIYNKAVAHLDEQYDLVVRTGAIFTLGKIANDSKSDRESIVKILSAYIRKHCYLSDTKKNDLFTEFLKKSTPNEKYRDLVDDIPYWMCGNDYEAVNNTTSLVKEFDAMKVSDAYQTFKEHMVSTRDSIPYWQKLLGTRKVSSDIDAAICVLGRRDRDYEPNSVDLCQVDLRGASFVAVNLKDTALSSSDMSGAAFMSSNFNHCVMVKVNMAGVTLHESSFVNANLSFSNFYGSDLKGADFCNADLSYCNFKGANLADVSFDGANLSGALLEDAINLCPTQLENALLDNDAKLPFK